MADKRLRLEKVGRCGLVTLDRPETLNALSRTMIESLDAAYRSWAVDPDIYGIVLESSNPQAFCSGGDLKELYTHWQHGEFEKMAEYYALEYRRIWSLDRFSKPSVALLDGVVMGGGIGISLYGTHRIAADDLRFGMPEVGIGFFPDIGATWFLPRLPSHIGVYMALTGRPIGAADAYWLGLVSHCVPAERFGDIRAAMIESDPIDTVLADMHRVPSPSLLESLAPVINDIFSAPSVIAVLERLDDVDGPASEWARGVADDIRRSSPVSLSVAFRQMQVGKFLDLGEALRLEYRITHHFLAEPDFFEGIRAKVLEKGRRPNWQPADLAAVDEVMVDAWFSELEGPNLRLGDSPANSAKKPKS